MDLPIRIFWLINNNIVRLMAEKDIRHLAVASSVGTSEGHRQTRENLVVEMGEVVKMNPLHAAMAERDEAGFQELRAMCM